MITLTRALARQLRAVLRKSITLGSGRGSRPPLSLHADGSGLRVRIQHVEVAVEFHQPGVRTEDVITLPAESLDEFEGRKEDAVILENVGASKVQARWNDGGVPQVREYAVPDTKKTPVFPEEPAKLFSIESGILKALDDACQTASKDNVRFALQKLQLRGGTGDIVATDGHQLLVQGGFALPWRMDVLVPAVSVFTCAVLPQDAPVTLGKTDSHVCVRVGAWTFYLRIDTDSHFPKTEGVIPAAVACATTCRLTAEEAEFLANALPRLPGQEDKEAPMTLDLDRQVVVRARSEGQSRCTEVVLSHSEVVGPAVRFASNRQFLARALQLGFTELRVTKPDVPVVCTDKFRTYLWMTLGKESTLPPSDDVLRITSAGDEPASSPPNKERSKDAMTRPQANGQSNGHTPPHDNNDDGHTTNGSGLGTLIAEAQGLKEALHNAYSRTSRLLAALKRHKKQTRLTATALASLRQLHSIDG